MKLGSLQQEEGKGKYILNSAIAIKCQKLMTLSFQSLDFLLLISHSLTNHFLIQDFFKKILISQKSDSLQRLLQFLEKYYYGKTCYEIWFSGGHGIYR